MEGDFNLRYWLFSRNFKWKIFELNYFWLFCGHISFLKVELAEARCLPAQAQRSELFS